MKTVLIVFALGLGAVAAFFAFQADYEKAFLAAALGAVAWILNYRQTLKEKLPPEDEDEEVFEDEESDEEVRS